MALLTSTAAGILAPEEVNGLVVQPVTRMSVAYQATQLVTITSNEYRFPILTENRSAAWVLEKQEIPVDDPTVTELTAKPQKVAALTVISRELANDSLENASAAEVVGQAIARDIARVVDVAMFSATAITNAPPGVGQLAGVSTASFAAGNLDGFAEAVSKAEEVGATLTSFVASPATALAMAQLKVDSADSNLPLLQQDPTQPTRRLIFGVPLLVSPGVADDVVWGLASDFAYTVQNSEATLDVDSSPYFTSDRLAIRGTLRLAWGFPHPKSVVKITVA
jgi:HK97 family phage major capsid protein